MHLLIVHGNLHCPPTDHERKCPFPCHIIMRCVFFEIDIERIAAGIRRQIVRRRIRGYCLLVFRTALRLSFHTIFEFYLVCNIHAFVCLYLHILNALDKIDGLTVIVLIRNPRQADKVYLFPQQGKNRERKALFHTAFFILILIFVRIIRKRSRNLQRILAAFRGRNVLISLCEIICHTVIGQPNRLCRLGGTRLRVIVMKLFSLQLISPCQIRCLRRPDRVSANAVPFAVVGFVFCRHRPGVKVNRQLLFLCLRRIPIGRCRRQRRFFRQRSARAVIVIRRRAAIFRLRVGILIVSVSARLAVIPTVRVFCLSRRRILIPGISPGLIIVSAVFIRFRVSSFLMFAAVLFRPGSFLLAVGAARLVNARGLPAYPRLLCGRILLFPLRICRRRRLLRADIQSGLRRAGKHHRCSQKR